MGKNNLDGIDFNKKNILPTTKKKMGRPLLKPGEKESETIVLKVTLAEYEAIKNKAGLAGLGTFVKHYIRTQTDLFK